MSLTPAQSPEATAGERTANTRAAYQLGAGSFAEWTIASAMNQLVMPLFTTAFGLSATLVGWAITIPRLVDAFSDPLIGQCSDHTRSRWGRRRPYILGGAILAALCFVVLWQAPLAWSEGAKFSHLLVVSVLLWIGYGFLSIPLGALTSEITDDYHERTRIAAIRSLFSILPTFATGWLYWLALQPALGGEIRGMRWISLGVAIIIIGAAAIPAVFARERFAHRTHNSIPLLAGLRQALASRPFVNLISVRVVVTLASYVFSGMLFYVTAYCACGGDKAFATKLLGFYGTLQVVVSLATLPFVPLIGRHLGKRALLVVGVTLHALTAFAAWYLLSPARPYSLLFLTLLSAPAGMLVGVFTSSALPDICDLDELQHGTRREGLFNSVMAFITKIEVSLCALVIGYLLTVANFAPGVAVQSPATLTWLRTLGIGPYFGLSLVGAVLALRYPVTAAQMADTRQQLAQRRAVVAG